MAHKMYPWVQYCIRSIVANINNRHWVCIWCNPIVEQHSSHNGFIDSSRHGKFSQKLLITQTLALSYAVFEEPSSLNAQLAHVNWTDKNHDTILFVTNQQQEENEPIRLVFRLQRFQVAIWTISQNEFQFQVSLYSAAFHSHMCLCLLLSAYRCAM